MGKKERRIVEFIFILGNLTIVLGLAYLLLARYIIFEIFLALLFLIMLSDSFLIFMYVIHKNMKQLSEKLGFTFLTRFLEQPRMEGIYNKNWFQIHFTSRAYSEYWGMPRTYIKLQFKETKKYNAEKRKKYGNLMVSGVVIKKL